MSARAWKRRRNKAAFRLWLNECAAKIAANGGLAPFRLTMPGGLSSEIHAPIVRPDPVAFVETWLGVPLEPWQKTMLRHLERRRQD